MIVHPGALPRRMCIKKSGIVVPLSLIANSDGFLRVDSATNYNTAASWARQGNPSGWLRHTL